MSPNHASLNLAFDDLKTHVLFHRDDVLAYLMAGTLLRWQGKLKQAYELHYNLLVHPKLRGDLVYRLNLELGYDLLALQKKDYGLSHFTTAARSRKHRTAALAGITQVHLALNHPEHAYVQLEELMNLSDPVIENFAQVIELASRRLRAMGDLSRAQKLLTQLLETPRATSDALQELLSIYLQSEAYDKVLPLVRRGLQDFPDSAATYLKALEDLYYRKGIYEECAEAFRRLLFDFPGQPELYYALGKHLGKQKRYTEALSYLERGLDLAPFHVRLFKLFVEFSEKTEGASSIKPRLDAFLQSSVLREKAKQRSSY